MSGPEREPLALTLEEARAEARRHRWMILFGTIEYSVEDEEQVYGYGPTEEKALEAALSLVRDQRVVVTP